MDDPALSGSTMQSAEFVQPGRPVHTAMSACTHPHRAQPMCAAARPQSEDRGTATVVAANHSRPDSESSPSLLLIIMAACLAAAVLSAARAAAFCADPLLNVTQSCSFE